MQIFKHAKVFSGQSVLIICFVFIISCATTQSEWQDTRKQDNVVAYETFIKNHPDSEFVNSAKSRIEELEWNNALRINTVDVYADFISKFSQSKHKSDAIENIKYIEWKNTKSRNTIESYEHFIDKYKGSQYSQKALLIINKLRRQEALNESLYTAVKSGDIKKIRQLIKEGADAKGENIMRAAIQTGSVDTVEVLIGAGSNAALSDMLIYAATENHIKIVLLLKKYGASIEHLSKATLSVYLEHDPVEGGITTDLMDEHMQKVEKSCNNAISASIPESKLIDNVVIGHGNDVHWGSDPMNYYPIYIVYEIVEAESKGGKKEILLAKCLISDVTMNDYRKIDVALCPPNTKNICLP